jgi:polyisoprenoid-binding protein YceI
MLPLGFRTLGEGFRPAAARTHRTARGTRGTAHYLETPSPDGELIRMLEARDRSVAPMRSLSIDSARSRLTFDVRYFGMLHVRGAFGDVRGEIVGMDPDKLSAASIAAIIPIASLNTGIPLRDWHLSSRGYLGVRRCPEAIFESESIAADGRHAARVIGRLTLRGVSREVVLHVRECWVDGDVKRRMHARASCTMRRSDFGIGPSRRAPWWDVRRYLIDDDVHLELQLEAVEQA